MTNRELTSQAIAIAIGRRQYSRDTDKGILDPKEAVADEIVPRAEHSAPRFSQEDTQWEHSQERRRKIIRWLTSAAVDIFERLGVLSGR